MTALRSCLRLVLFLTAKVSLLAWGGILPAAQIMGINDGVLWFAAGTLALTDGTMVNTWTNSATRGNGSWEFSPTAFQAISPPKDLFLSWNHHT